MLSKRNVLLFCCLLIAVAGSTQSTHLQVVQDSVKVLNGALSINNPANRFYAGSKLTFSGPDSISLSTGGPLTLKGVLPLGNINDSLVTWDPATKNLRAQDAAKSSPFLRGAYPGIAGTKNFMYLRYGGDSIMFGGNNVAYARFNFLGTSNFYDRASFGPSPPSPNAMLSINGNQQVAGNGLSVMSGSLYSLSGSISDIWSFSYVNQNDTVNSSYVSMRAQARTSGYSYQGSNLMAGMDVLIENGATNGSTTYKNAEGYRAYFNSGANANYRAVRGFHVLPYEGTRVTDYFAGVQIDSVTAPVTNLYGIMQKGNNMKNSFAGKMLIGTVPSGSLATDSILVYSRQDSVVKLVSMQVLTAGVSSLSPAGPTSGVGLTALNGVASTYMRSDAAPALSQSIAPNWTNAHTFSNYVNLLTGARLTSYNTTDTSSTYDRIIAAWNSNVYEIGSYYGGVGGSGNSIVRSMRMGVNTTAGSSNLSTSSRTFTINSSPAVQQGVFDFSPSTTSIAGSIFTLRGAGTVSSGTQNWFTIQPTFNVTGSPTLNTLLIQPWFQAGGGGSNYLINAGTQSAADGGGTFTQRFFITSAGIGYISSRFAVGNPSATASLQVSSNNNTGANYGTTGLGFVIDAATYTSSSSSGTISTGTAHSFGIPTLAASNATTLTNAATFYIAGAPAAGTNVTITNPWAAYINGNIGVNGDVLPLTNSNYNLGNSSFRWNQASIITTLTNFIKPVSGSDVSIRNSGGSDIAKFFGSTANVVLQNGGTLTDNGYRLDVQGTARITGNVTLPHIIGGSSTPSIVANTGAGTSPTINISGTDAGFTVTLTAGASPTSGADIFTVTFSNAYSATPNGVGLANINANALAVFSNVYSTPSTTTYKLSLANGVALTAGQQYKWSVTLIQ